jgi:hypothetical protein
MTITGTVGPPTWVDGPFPVVRKSRLLDVATIKDDDGEGGLGRWRDSAQVWAYPEDGAFTWNPCPEGTFTNSPKFEGGVSPIPIFNAFQVYVSETCTARSANLQDPQEFIARAQAVFAATESHGVEHVLAAGLFGGSSPYLADASANLLDGGAAQSLTESLCALEDAIAETQRGGVIHATAGTVTGWESLGFTLDRVGPTLVTRACQTPIVVGTGYAHVHPDSGSVAGAKQAWAFATGPVDVRRGTVEVLPPLVKQALDRSDNTITYRVERDYLVDWDTVLQAAVLVDRTI